MKDVKGYEGLYQIDENGNVYSFHTNRFLKPAPTSWGYLTVELFKNGKGKTYKIHRMVAEAFIPNNDNKPLINHKDGNKTNNNVDNLEWCTEKYNTNYGNARVKQARAVSKAVVCIETGKVFSSQKEAGQIMGITHQHICDCCKGKKQTCGGYHWRYATKEEAEEKLKELQKNG